MNLEVIEYEKNWIAGLYRGGVSPADESFAPNCVIHMAGAPEPDLSVSDFKELVAGLLTAFPNLQISVVDQVISGDKIPHRWVANGTHDGPLGEVQPTGKHAKFEGLIFDYAARDQVVERWEQWDQMGMLQQLGLICETTELSRFFKQYSWQDKFNRRQDTSPVFFGVRRQRRNRCN